MSTPVPPPRPAPDPSDGTLKPSAPTAVAARRSAEPAAATGEPTILAAARRRALRKRGVLLASGGLLLALAVGLGLRQVGLAAFDTGEWAAALGATLVVQGGLWLVLHRGWDARLEWDPHFIYIPMIAAALLLNAYIFVIPEARVLILMAWFVALLFMAGLAGLSEVVLLSGFMASGYLAAVSLRAAEGFPVAVSFEVSMAGVFFAICCYAGFVFRRLRSERRQMRTLRRELAELATRDPLTGLPNRRHFEHLLREELLRTQRYGGHCAVAMLDVDHFKIYNDTLGHLAGDEVLRELAALLERHLRETDLAARYGGEEFALILVNTELEEARPVVERLRRIVEGHPFEGERVLPQGRLTVSAGIAAAQAGDQEFEEIIRRADMALYEAKHAGRNRVRLAVPRR